jgi:endonuclease YncB( thermonuclease family)
MVTPRWMLSKRSAVGASFRGWVSRLIFWMPGVLVLMLLAVPDGASADPLTVRIIEEPLVSQPSPFSSTGETVVVPRTRIIIGGDSTRNRKRDAQHVSIEGNPLVIDGDTFRIQGRVLQLYGVDAVEVRQSCRYEGIRYPCGTMATAHLVELILGRDVLCTGVDKNRSGELLANCRVDGKELSALMVASGWVLANSKETTLYVSDQERAKESKVGMWRGEFVRPWVWRIKH